MRLAVPHNTSRDDARRIVDQRAEGLMRQFGVQAGNVEKEWIGDALHVRGKAHGLQIKAMVEVTESEVIIDGDLPLLAKAFEPKIKEMVQREAEQMFRKA